MTKSRLENILEKVLPRDIPAEILVLKEDVQGIQVRNNNLIQGSRQQKILVRVRAEEGGRVGVETTNVLSLPSLRQTLARARKRAAAGRPGPLVLSDSKGLREAPKSDSAMALSPQDQAALVAPLANLAGKSNLLLDARLATQAGEFTIVNTAGLAASAGTVCSAVEMRVASATGPGSGYGYACHCNGDKLDVAGAFLAAAAKCQASEQQRSLQAGEYTVIFEPAAVADLMAVAAEILFDGRAFFERRTPFSRLGVKLFSDQLNIWDDSLNLLGLQMPFDFEGVAKQRLNLINRGVLQAVCLDNETAAGLKTASTGHAAPPGSSRGPIPWHLAVEAGNAMIDDMIASTERGILVSRLHNISVLDMRAALITGIAAGGTLLVEKGKLTSALPDLRFVQNLIHALNNIEMTGDESKFFGGLWKGFWVPALKLNNFSFLAANTGLV